jgi:hypothetical protein
MFYPGTYQWAPPLPQQPPPPSSPSPRTIALASSSKDIEFLLRAWLTPVPNIAGTAANCVFHDASFWVVTHTFRRQESVHTAYYCPATGAYALHVHVPMNVYLPSWTGARPTNMGIYTSWDAMIYGAAQRYAFLWFHPGFIAQKAFKNVTRV